MIVRSRAPLRLGLAGGGTDVSPFCDTYGGCVMNVTIDKYAYVTIDDSPSGKAEFYAQDAQVSEIVSVDKITAKTENPLQLMKGVYLYLSERYLEGKRPLVRIRTHSDAPPGSGLGSSSTMVVALVTAFGEYFSLAFGEYELAHIAYEIERNELLLAGGRQDQYAAAFGGFNFMEFYANDRVIVNPLRIKNWIWAELKSSLVLYFTGVSRSSAKIIEEQTHNIHQQRPQSIDAMHQLKTEAIQMKEALLRGEIHRFAQVMQAGWEAKKQMASSISNPMIDQVEKIAFENGARATKVSGAGGGGFMMFICDPSDRIRLQSALRQLEGTIYNANFTPHGSSAWKIA